MYGFRSTMRLRLIAAATVMALEPSCAPIEPVTSADTPANQSILQRTSPAADGRIQGPVEQIQLWFDPPARLLEVTVTDAEGLIIPIMVTAIGETDYYAIPIGGLSEGNYSVSWRATMRAQNHAGIFRFTVK